MSFLLSRPRAYLSGCSFFARRFMESCTPGYYNNEGKAVDQEEMRSHQGYPQVYQCRCSVVLSIPNEASTIVLTRLFLLCRV